MQTILVTGGCGYIGSHMVRKLLKEGYSVVVIDNLERGFEDVITTLRKDTPKSILHFEKVDLRRKHEIQKVFKKYSIDAVVHFAAYAEVGESMKYPSMYFENNVNGSMNLFKVMLENKVKKIVFSSTCATYGEPEIVPITESEKQKPSNYYGLSKLMVEQILKSLTIEGLSSIGFRYFNAAGNSSDLVIGERHNPESHLIPRVLQYALGKRKDFKLFGNDFPTPDGTCIRDYIHVEDLAEVHLLGLKYLDKQKDGYIDFFNLGTGVGVSNKQIIDEVKKVTKINFKYETIERRPGDPAKLIADPSKVEKVLKWKYRKDIKSVIQDQYNWMKKNTY